MNRKVPFLRMWKVSFVCLVLSILWGASPGWAKGPTADERARYEALAAGVPNQAGYAFLVAHFDRSLSSLNELLVKFAANSSKFDLAQFEQTVKGTFGYNPFHPEELNQSGLDVSKGFSAFGLGQEGPPLIVAATSDTAKARKSLETLALNVGNAKPCEIEEKWGSTRTTFRLSCTPDSKVVLMLAERNGMIYMMFFPETPAWAERHFQAALELKPADSLAKAAYFSALLDRIEPGSSLVQVGDYQTFLKDVKSDVSLLQEKAGTTAETEEQKAALSDLDSLVKWAGVFDGQIAGMTFSNKKLAFVHAVTGPKDKVKKFSSQMKAVGNSRLNSLKLNPDTLGSMRFFALAKEWVEVFSKDVPAWSSSFEKVEAEFLKESGLNIRDDIFALSNGELLVNLYGVAPLDQTACMGQGLGELDLLRHFRLVAATGIRKGANAKGFVKKINTIADKRSLVRKPVGKSGTMHEIVVNGLPLQYGYEKQVFFVGIGTQALQTALKNRRKIEGFTGKDRVMQLKMDLPKAAKSMEALRPDAACTNTQIHQVFKFWEQEILPTLFAFDAFTLYTVHHKDGFSTHGELTIR